MDTRELSEIKKEIKLFLDGVPHYIEPQSNCSSMECGLHKVDLQNGVVVFYLSHPGMLIGKGGKNLDRMKRYVDYPYHIVEFNPLGHNNEKINEKV